MLRLLKSALLSSIIGFLMLAVTSTHAAMVGTDEIVSDSTRTQLQENLQRKEVQLKLIEMGVDPEAALRRAENLTDQEIADISGKLNELPAGAGLSNVELLLIIIIIILLV